MTRRLIQAIGVVLALGVLGASAGAQEQAAAYFKNLNDLPLMPGLYEVMDESLTFDKPEGRIVEAMALGKYVQPSEIISFYEKALPALGWVRQGPQTYGRGAEILRFSAENRAGAGVLRIRVAPGS